MEPRLSIVTLGVADVGKARKFYESLGFKASAASQDSITAIRGQGLMLGIECAKEGAAARAMDDLRAQGIIVLPSGSQGKVLSITPALNIDENLLISTLGTICNYLCN